MGLKGSKKQRQSHRWIPSGRAKRSRWTKQDGKLSLNGPVHRQARFSAFETEDAAWGSFLIQKSCIGVGGNKKEQVENFLISIVESHKFSI